ncbi:MAG: hypothetical protein AAGG68_12010 [Bacteroidota bacterium]
MTKKITFLTRHYPPNPNINGESVRDMVKYLEEEFQIESRVICIDRKAEGGGANRQPAGEVLRLKTPYQGENALLRFFTFLYDGFILTKKALQYKDTLIICTTSPPLLPFWASLMFGKKIQWALWSLDLFPEGFYATGMIRKENLFYKWVLKRTYKNKPNFLIALGEEQAKHLQSVYKAKVPYELLPCGVFFYQNKSETPPDWYESDKLYFGYCGNINDAHNPEIIKGVIDALDPAKHRIVLALYGNKAAEVKAYAEGKAGVILVDRVPREQLHFIDIHIVTLLKKWTHIAVPSKAVSAIFMGGSLLFCGSEQSDNWQMFKEAGWFVEENDQIKAQVKSIIKSITKEEVEHRKAKTPALVQKLQNYVLETYKNIANQV